MFLRYLNKIEEGIISILLVAMTLLVFIEVVLRFGFGTGLSWGQELTLHLSAWFVLFGISYGLKVGAHISVDAFVKLFSPAVQRLLSLLAISLALSYCALFLYGSWVYLEKMYMIGISMEDLEFQQWMVNWMSEETQEQLKIWIDEPLVPLWLAHGMLLVGFSFFSIRLLELLWAVAVGRAHGFCHVNEAEESLHLADELKCDAFGEVLSEQQTESPAQQPISQKRL
ncbi:MAG: TRAP transporter small permease [Gammaproteobacteria bacterium]|jgi:C4-dicarboxylate transporter DctQ subunit|nr:TRAP transporter small permease [Gammaproteobacteria bacterium]MBT3488543.1 TRAP transporter small permease [Gammaproteobacteria bacterium]MBT3719647.1 TRAP transporter small permease [Gammaproteobacteria bacterium]MBT3843726.1 TRAP transporter small permease [Gammaproteobacteria bacterium]MBT3892282.1 TRAP transporter small permease [Gammaproteobacteria bacterium]